MMLLQMAVDGFGDRVAIGKLNGGLTYTKLFEEARNVASKIRACQIESVGFIDVTTPNLPVSLFASAWAGHPFVPLNFRLTDEELTDLTQQISPSYLVAGSKYYSKVENVDGLTIEKSEELTSLAPKNICENSDWSTDPEKEAVLLFTSGTTGKPKAAILRHKHLVSYVLGTQEFMSSSPEEATLMSVPPYHIACMANIVTSIYTGRRIVMMPNFEPVEWIKTAKSENITHAMVVPTMLWRIVEELDKMGEKIEEVTNIAYGGGKMPIDVIERALEVFPNTAFVNAYGLTETSSTVSVLGPEDHRKAHASKDPKERMRLTSVGKPLPTLEVSIRNEEGQEIPAKEHGEIWVRGEQVSGEYVGRKSCLNSEGWFQTNDGGWFDENGYLYIEGRLDDVIVKGGENISPGEIEDALRNHKAVVDVAAFGIPDTEWGETIAVAVVLHKDAEISAVEIQDFIRQNLRSSRVPDKVEFCNELPYNETGKLLRRKLKESSQKLSNNLTDN